MKALQIAALAAAAALLPAPSHADQTNLVQTLSVELMGVAQGPTVTNGGFVMTTTRYVPVDSRAIIAALRTATGTAFSPGSRLFVVTPLDGGDASIQVRDGTTTVDVTAYFAHETLSDTVQGSAWAGNWRSRRVVNTEYNIQRLVLQDAGAPVSLHFDVRGFAAQTSAGNAPGGELDIRAAGTGSRNGTPLILQGFIVVRGQALEVTTSPGGGPAT
ncbi:MAG: hypothetical protein U1F98_04660 [Verrucomicrobiota bacterium]